MSPTPEAGADAPRGSFLLPTAFTVLNLFFGFMSIVKSFSGDLRWAAALLMLAAVLDKLDGLVARATNSASEFGAELDSLADVISFGMAPALLAYAWALSDLRSAGWVTAFAFLACGALRLARFNVQTAASDRRWFVGLPIPMAAAVPVTIVFACDLQWPGMHPSREWTWAFLALMLVLAFLMVSTFRYWSFKDIRVGRERRLVAVLVLAGVIASIAAWPEIFLPVFAAAYAVHGPVLRVVRAARQAPRSAPSA